MLLIGCNDTIAAVDGEMSHRRVRVSDSDGSVGSEKSAEEERKGPDAISSVGEVSEIVVPEGTVGDSGVKRGNAQPSLRERQELGGGVDVDEGVCDEDGD